MTTVTPIVREFSPTTVIVSRVQRFYDYPDKIFPVSCTNVEVQDTYFNDELDENGEPIVNFYESIAGSRYYVSKVLKGNAGVVVDLSFVRPRGEIGSNGMISAGVGNFMAGYSVCNIEIRRGSAFRNGAVVLQLDANHPDLEEFLNCPTSIIPWAKRGVTVSAGWRQKPYYKLIEKALAEGVIFLYKQQYDASGRKLKINVCQGILFASRSTCTLAHVNLGLIRTISDLAPAFLNGAKDLDTIWTDFHGAWSGSMGQQMSKSAKHFIDPEDDKQVGLGVLGLANMLVNFKVTYADFAEALDILTLRDELDVDYYRADEFVPGLALEHLEPKALELARGLIKAYDAAGDFFKSKNYLRGFTVEPTATCSYKQFDYNGYTTTPEISPPIASPGTKVGRRLADHGFEDYQYPPKIEVAGHDIPWEVYDQLCQAWQRMMNNTGLAHCISYNWWLSKPVNEETMEEWDKSELVSVYYRWKEKSSDADKTSIGIEVDEESESFWTVGEEWDDSDPPVVCQLGSGGCTSCGE